MRARDWALDERVRGSARVGISRVSSSWFAILQAAVAAGLSWLLAKLIVGQPQPFFAPAAAVISLGLSRGQPRRRAVELSIGVAVGIGIAALIVKLIGVGAIQVTVLVALVMTVALLFGSSPVLINQASVSALLIMTLPGQGAEIDRFLDACVGGAVAVVIGQFLLFRDPIADVAEARRVALADLAGALEEIAAVLAAPELGAAERALARARRLDGQVDVLYDAVSDAGETVAFSPRRRALLERLDPQSEAAPQLDYAVRDTRVLARATVTAARREIALDPHLGRGAAALAGAARALGDSGPRRGKERDGRRAVTPEFARQATEAAREASRADAAGALWATMIVGQIRAIAFDLLRAAGEDPDEARARLGPPEPTAESQLPRA
jgi:uncharacterized membrane protein YgaE (UPF0421/DUF939 family)